MAQSTDRNAPCPCGSGRKYNNCCLAGQTRVLPLYNAQDREKAIGAVLSYCEEFRYTLQYGKARHEAWTRFWGPRMHEAIEKLDQEPENAEFCLNSFLYYWLFDFSLDKDDETVASRFLFDEGNRLPRSQRLFLERMAGSSMRICEVIAIKPDEVLDLRELEGRQVSTVKERLATHSLATWDIVAGRVMPGPEGFSVAEGGLYPFRTVDSGKIKLAMEQWRRGYLNMYPDWPAPFHKMLSTHIHHLWVDLELLRPPPALVTTGQEPLVFAKTFFDVRDPGRVTAELSACLRFIPQDDGSYVWLEGSAAADKMFGKVLGIVSVSENRLTLDTFSEARAASGQTFLEELLGETIHFRATRLEDPMQAALAGERKPPAREVAPPGLESEIVSQLYRNHYEAWLDQPIPALDNRTPRKAATLKTMRPRLIALLKELDNQIERDQLGGRPMIDTDWLWEELGLQRK